MDVLGIFGSPGGPGDLFSTFGGFSGYLMIIDENWGKSVFFGFF